MQNMKRLLALLLAIIMLLPFAFANIQSAQALDASDLADYINTSVAGLSASASGATVTVTGAATSNATLTLDISAGVVLDWQAGLSGSVKGAFLLSISGNGTFNFVSGNINNTGTGGQILVEGIGATINVDGSLTTTTNGISLNIAANDVTVNVNSTGEIVNNGSNSAINVSPGNTGVKINVIGGKVESTPSGYAINDGSAEPPCPNTTQIVIDNGTIKSGSACAIRSSGIGSTVTVRGNSEISNAAGSNTNSTIYMNGESGTPADINVTIEDSSRVYTENTTSGTSYVIQTTRGVLVKDNAIVSANAGRAINLVGMYSVATVEGNAIVETISGTAICTATTIPLSVAYASVVVKSGIVQATGTGTAIRITGANSTVDIEGGWVTAKQGFAVDASSSPGSGPLADTTPINISDGFVFAWGNGINKVVTPSTTKLDLTSQGIIVAWNTTTGEGIYTQNDTEDLSFLPNPPTTTAYWELNPDTSMITDGIQYDNGSNIGYFPLDVIVDQFIFTLTVINGTADDGYSVLRVPAGNTVNIYANADEPINPNIANTSTIFNFPINGNVFSNWTTDIAGLLTDPSLRNNSFTMPSANVVATASYNPRYLLCVTGGNIISPRNFGASASYGYYCENEEIQLLRNSGMTWSFGAMSNLNTITSVFTMPNYAAAISAYPVASAVRYPATDTKTLTVVGGTIGSTTAGLTPATPTSFTGLSGTGLNIASDPPPLHHVFDYWEVSTAYKGGAFFDAQAPNTTFILSDENVTLTAKYRPITYLLMADNGSGSYLLEGSHEEDEHILITAAPLQLGRSFIGWTIDSGGGEFDDPALLNPTYTMPDSDAYISAHYEWSEYTLTYENGDDGFTIDLGTYHYGDQITIIADAPPTGMNFTRWTVSATGGGFADTRNPATVFTMPASDVIVTANYARPGGNMGGTGGGGSGGQSEPEVPDSTDDTDDTDDPEEIDKPNGSTEGPDNTDPAPIDIAIRANKIVSGTGAILENGQFEFSLYDDSDNLLSTSSNDANGNIEFDPISFAQEGRYTYKAIETSQNGDGWIVDSREFVFTVIVSLENGELKAAVQNAGGTTAAFHNRYSAALASSETTSATIITPSTTTPFIEDHLAYISGYPDSTVRPGSDITRAEVAMVFRRLLSEELLEADTGEAVQFSDVDPSRWYGSAITVMHNLGIINGYPDGTFRPDTAITRAELATVAAHFATMMHMSPAVHVNFSDIEEHWAQLDILYAAKIGWLNGYPDGSFMPLRNITRAEFISLVNRVLRRIPETADDLLDGMKTWTDNADPSAWYYIAIQEATNSHTHGYKDQLTRSSDVQYEYWVELIN